MRLSRLALPMLTLMLAGCGAQPHAPAPRRPAPAVAPAPPTWSQLPTGFPSAPLARANELTARKVNVRNGFFYGIGTFKATIEVQNPSDLPRTGVLTVAFVNGAQRADHVETKVIALGPHQKRTYEFEDERTTIDNVSVSIVTDPISMGAVGDMIGR